MHLSRDSLDQPAREMAHRLARELTKQVAKARDRLRGRGDPEALHDFRVALRRLRTILRAHRPHIEAKVGKDVRKRLRQLAEATGASRDLEVHLAWLAETRQGFSPGEQVGASWLIRRLRARKREADAELRRQIGRLFAPLYQRLDSRLARYTLRLDLDDPAAEPTYGAASRELLLQLAVGMRGQLADVRSLADRSRAHAARIQGKRLRYLLEPMVGFIAGGEELVALLKRVQDQLGGLHDANVFSREISDEVGQAGVEQAQPDPRPGLMALAARLRERSEQLFAELRADGWIGGAHPFFEQLEEACASLSGPPRGKPEIERKYLLNDIPPLAKDVVALEIEQGYLPGEELVERLRRVRSPNGVRCYRTVKLGSGLLRTELEEESSPEIFEAMWPLTAGRRVMKRRRIIADGERRWEIDEFTDRSLVLAEVELPAAGTPVTLPDWLQPHVVNEVTDDPAYRNDALAQ